MYCGDIFGLVKAQFLIYTHTNQNRCYMKVNMHAHPLVSGLRSVFLVSCFLIFLGTVAFSQTTVTVSGRVTLGAGAADLSGTSIQVKGSRGGVTTDATGHFSISVKSGATLVFSHVGYKSLEVRASGQNELSLTLETADNSLEQVTVSYGRQRKRDITGAVNKVDAAAIRDVPATEFGQKLYGKVAGLQINQATGIPGQGIFFRIRGAASLSGGNQPLIVVDGLPLAGDIVNLVNPEDIESFSVLKDAGATALYGSRASNGVILITTRQGKVGKTSVSANAYYGLQSVPQRGRPNVMNAREFATYMKGWYEDKAKYETPAGGTPVTVPADYANPEQYGKGTDWYDAILRTAPMQTYSVNISAGTEKILSSTTFSYFDQSGVLYNTGVRRYSFRSNNEYRPIDRIKVGLNISPSWQVDHNVRAGSLGLDGNRQIVSGGTFSSPLSSVYDSNGKFTMKSSSAGMLNTPNFRMQEEIMNVNQNNLNLLSNAFVDVEVTKGLHARSTMNADFIVQDYNAYYGTLYAGFNTATPPRPLAQSSAVNSSNNSTNILNENTLSYTTKFGEHSLEGLAGYSYQKYSQNYRSISGTGYPNDAVPWINGTTTTSGNSNKQAWSLASAFARVNYDYQNRYYLSATIRRDGSSRFGEYKKYGTFPSVSAGWVISDEGFFPRSNTLSFLKIRGSYGLTGNFNVGNYTQATLASSTNYVFGGVTTLGQSLTVLGNPDLTWETSKQADFGLEATFLNSRLTFSYDYYNKRTENMLSNAQLPAGSGYTVVSYNIGTFRMWGHEFQVTSKNLVGKLNWSTDLNIGLNDNKVLALVAPGFIGGTNKYNDYNRTAVGHRIGELYGYIFDGLYMNAADFAKYPKEATSAIGSARMRDVSGDNKIDISDRTFIGNPSPRMTFGITNNFTYLNFDLNIIASGQTGNKIINTNYQNLQNLDAVFNINKDMQYRWRSEQDPGNGKVPRTLGPTTELYRTTNTNWVFSGDYLCIKNIALGYTFSQKQLRYIKSVRVYGSIQNAWYFTKYPGQNPEVNDNRDSQTTAGQDIGSYPVVRTVMIGANINF